MSAWILEPCLGCPGLALGSLLSGPSDLANLQKALIDHKKDTELHENIAGEAAENDEAMARAAVFLADLARIADEQTPTLVGWKQRDDPGLLVYTASFITRK